MHILAKKNGTHEIPPKSILHPLKRFVKGETRGKIEKSATNN